jgi:hypothetical protein
MLKAKYREEEHLDDDAAERKAAEEVVKEMPSQELRAVCCVLTDIRPASVSSQVSDAATLISYRAIPLKYSIWRSSMLGALTHSQ